MHKNTHLSLLYDARRGPTIDLNDVSGMCIHLHIKHVSRPIHILCHS